MSKILLIIPCESEIASLELTLEYHIKQEQFEQAAETKAKIDQLKSNPKDTELEVKTCNVSIIQK